MLQPKSQEERQPNRIYELKEPTGSKPTIDTHAHDAQRAHIVPCVTTSALQLATVLLVL